MPTLARRLLLLFGGGWIPNFLLRDDFTTTAGAPLTSPRTAEPGPGTLTITDTGPNLSISGGALVSAAKVADNNPGLIGSSFSRRTGLAYLAKYTHNNLRQRFGFESSLGTTVHDFDVGAGAYVGATGVGLSGAFSNATVYTLAVVLLSSGAFYLVKGGIYTNWTVFWIDNATTTTPIKPVITQVGASTVLSVDFVRVLDLPTPFDTDFGLATQRLAGSVADGTTFAHEANGHIELNLSSRPTGAFVDVQFRKQDSNNYWIFRFGSSSVSLVEVVAGTPTTRATASPGGTGRGVVVFDGATIRGYFANVLQWTYSSASNFATATNGLFSATGGSPNGAASDIISWPRTLSAPASTYLDSAVA